MPKKIISFTLVLIAGVLVACSSQGNGGNAIPGGMPITLPGFGSDMAVTAVLPPKTVGEELPSEGLGTILSTFWRAKLGGFTQTQYSQSLGFAPGTKVTLRNLSKNTQHTLDEIAEISKPPAKFPSNPSLPIKAHGFGFIGPGYASGVLNPGKSVTINLKHAGIYLIGCAFHYGQGMRDVFVVAVGARPGKQATPPPRATTSPSPRPTTSYYPG